MKIFTATMNFPVRRCTVSMIAEICTTCYELDIYVISVIYPLILYDHLIPWGVSALEIPLNL
jgi:hypothetical protein